MPEITPLTATDPRSLGAYRLTGRLGEGGQGVVYLGEGPGSTAVAVKALRAEWAQNPQVKDRFVKEMAAAQRVSPFCVAQVLEADFDAVPPYIVTEYVAGPTLSQSVREDGPRSGPALHRLAVATATALAAIHEAGVAHRDFKPANVLLGSDGPRVIDFGIARTLDGAATLTGGVVGTPTYMAPEQFEGMAGAPADVFAWGCVIVFAATGRPPFGTSDIHSVTYRILNTEPDLGDLGEPLREIVTAALRKNPAERPTTRQILFRLLGRPGSTDVPFATTLASVGRDLAQHPETITWPGTDPSHPDAAPYASGPYGARAPGPYQPGGRADGGPYQPGGRHPSAYAPGGPYSGAGGMGTVPAAAGRSRRGLAIGLAAAAVAVVLVGAAVAWPLVRDNGTGTPRRSVTPTQNGQPGGVTRTPRLGLEFWQGGAQDGMSFGTSGGKDVVTVAMKAAPFELRLPKLGAGIDAQVCAWTDASIFSLTSGDSTKNHPFFGPGTGIADYEYGSGTLYLNNQGHNSLGGTRVTAASAAQDKVDFATTWQNKATTPLQQRKGDLFLTIFIDKNKDTHFTITDPAEFEYVVLHFPS